MGVLVGSDGASQLDLGNGLKYIANIFSWKAQLRREILDQTTQADDYKRRTAGLGDWTGSFSFRLQFSEDESVAQSAWQLLNYVLTNTDDDLKADLSLILQSYQLASDCDIFQTTIADTIQLTGTVVISDVSLDCTDPEQPIIAVASWEADGALLPQRGDDGNGIEEMIIWFDDESAQVFPAGAAVVTAIEGTGDYETTEHLGQTAYAPPPGTLDTGGDNALGGGWAISMPDALTSGDFTIEGWARSSTASPPAGGRGTVGIALAWDGDASNITMQSEAFRLSAGLTAEHQVAYKSQYETVYAQIGSQLFGTSVQGWKHLCYQRINGEDNFHYHGVRFTLADGDASLPSPRPVTSDAQLFVGATNEATSGVALGQVRVSTGALYGTGTFTPPSTAFYTAPG